jgi:hypothetical protein
MDKQVLDEAMPKVLREGSEKRKHIRTWTCSTQNALDSLNPHNGWPPLSRNMSLIILHFTGSDVRLEVSQDEHEVVEVNID